MSENELVDTVQNFIDIVKADNRVAVRALPESDPNFDSVAFWLQFCVGSQKVARAATKLMLAYSLSPGPSVGEVSPLVAELVASYNSVVTCYLALPRDRGHHLAKAVTSTLGSIQSSLIHFLNLFVNAIKEPRGVTELCSVGVLLEECKQVTSLPRDNRQAVISVIQVDHDFMIDTVDEITAELKNQINLGRSGKQGVVSGESEVWTKTEFTIVNGTLKLAKLARLATETALKVLKQQEEVSPTTCGRAAAGGGGGGGSSSLPRSLGLHQLSRSIVKSTTVTNTSSATTPSSGLTSQEIALLDELASHSSHLSPELDDLYAFIYPPIDDEALPSLVDKFVLSVTSFLNYLDNLPELSQVHRDLTARIKVQLTGHSDELKTLLVSNEILAISDMSIQN